MTPSRFWQGLAGEHQRDLESFGFLRFKRHQALRYFTWQWRWRSIRQSEQFRFLLRNTSPADWLRCARAGTELSDRAWDGVSWSRADRWLYAFAVRLLWLYSRDHDDARILDLREPELGAPFPVQWEGRLISQDLANSALELSTILGVLDGQVPRHIMEVGAGYGRTAYALLHTFPNATYTVVDIEPAIDISRRYLTELFPTRVLRFLHPDEAAELSHTSIDLALSISSLQEMTPDQVEFYISLFDRVASGGAVYLKQWASWSNPVDKVTLTFDDYPIPAHWILKSKHTAPVQTRFVEAAWTIPD